MVKVLFLVTIMCGLVSGVPAPQTSQARLSPAPSPLEVPEDTVNRSERSTDLLYSGTSGKLQLHVKNRYLQVLPDGTVNGTLDVFSAYSELSNHKIFVVHFGVSRRPDLPHAFRPRY